MSKQVNSEPENNPTENLAWSYRLAKNLFGDKATPEIAIQLYENAPFTGDDDEVSMLEDYKLDLQESIEIATRVFESNDPTIVLKVFDAVFLASDDEEDEDMDHGDD